MSESALRIALLFSACLSGAAYAGDDGKRWVHGSWVNVRSTAAPDSAVMAHLNTNQAVTVKAEQNGMCDIAWEGERHGYMACKLLGERPLTLEAAAKSPLRAFWIAPSMKALFEAGAYFQNALLSEAQRQAENLPITETAPPPARLVRYPVPEFEAMKTLLAKGVVAGPDHDPALRTCAQLGEPKGGRLADENMAIPCHLLDFPTLALPAVRPSLFKNARELAPGSAGLERLSAHFGIIERGTTLAGPQWQRDYDMMRYTSAWDIGKYQLSLERPLVEHVIGRSGLVGAYTWKPQASSIPSEVQNCAQGLTNKRMGKQLVDGYPRVKDALLWFQGPQALPFKTAKVATRSLRSPIPDTGQDTGGIRRVAVYEIDLDGDGVADFVQWDLWSKPQVSGPDPMLARRLVFVNIGGQWYPFEQDSYGECT